MNLYLMSATSSLRPDWTEYAKAPEAPSNYKDPEKIRAYVEAKRANLEKEIEQHTRLVDFHKIKVARYDSSQKSYSHAWSKLSWDVINNPSSTYIVGNKGRTILNMMVRNEDVLHDVFGDDIDGRRMVFFLNVNYFGIKYLSFDEFMFSAKEREYLLTEKLIPVKREDYSDDVDYMIAALETFGFDPKSFTKAVYYLDKN